MALGVLLVYALIVLLRRWTIKDLLQSQGPHYSIDYSGNVNEKEMINHEKTNMNYFSPEYAKEL